ncbi:hypothetical protein ACS0TY_014829 [Phlomoides rotata]
MLYPYYSLFTGFYTMELPLANPHSAALSLINLIDLIRCLLCPSKGIKVDTLDGKAISKAASCQKTPGIEPGKRDYAYTSPSSKENDHQEIFQDKESRKANHADTSFFSKLEETEYQASKPNVSEQPNTSGVKERERDQPKTSKVAPGFQEFSELPDYVFNAIHKSWYNNPHLKRGEELEIKLITVASEDTTNAIKYLSFHFMKLQKSDQKAFTYIKE